MSTTNEPVNEELLWGAIERCVKSQTREELETFMCDDLTSYYFECASQSEIEQFIDTWPEEPAPIPPPPAPATLAEAKALPEIPKDEACIIEWNVPVYNFLDENNRLMYVVKTTYNTYAKKEYELCLNSI